MEDRRFKQCSMCGKNWETLDAFLSDPHVQLIGYQINLIELEEGLFYFLHKAQNCGTTLAFPLKEFSALSHRSFLSQRGSRPENCGQHCLRKEDLSPCPIECECVWVREVMQTIRERGNLVA